MSSRVKLFLGGTVTYVAAVAIGYSYFKKPQPEIVNHVPHTGPVTLEDKTRHEIYAKNANKYDSEISFDEFFMGLNFIRWQQIGKAKGKVLEVGSGTGRNFTYYDSSKVESIVAIDSVGEMLQHAKSKMPKNINTELRVMNAHDIRYPDSHFDTVIDTFGLCSYDDPIKVLKEMSRVCKKDGKILLLEHGKGSYDWINDILDKSAHTHAHNWGCIYNKDIKQLVVDSGLKIVNVSRWHFGTTYVIEAKPTPSS